MEIICVPVIAAIVYGIIELLKIAFKSEKFLNFVPLISGMLGGVLGIIAYVFSPSIIPASNYLNSFLVGMVSGLSATGTHQTIKQINSFIKTASKGNDTSPDDKNNSNDKS